MVMQIKKHKILASFGICSGIVLILLLAGRQLEAQDLDPGWKNWTMTNFTVKPNKKFSIRAGGLYSFNPTPARLGFAQTSLEVTYRANKHWYVGGEYNTSIFPRGNEGRKIFHRVGGEASRRGKLFGLKVKNTFKLQWYLPRVQKYALRGVYQFKMYFKNSFLPLQATPYLSHDFMWYLGGKPNVYFDEFDEIAAFQSAAGLHRYRLSAGISFKPFKNLSVNLFYKRQWEFNTGILKHRGLNIAQTNDYSPKIPFNNFWVWGGILSYTLRLY
jgi:hypothetical protein